MRQGLRRFVFGVCAVVAAAGWAAASGWAQEASPQAAVVAKQALGVVMKHYIMDPLAVDARTNRPLPTNGSWSAGKTASASCPQSKETCVEVVYEVESAQVRCSWVVLLTGDGSDGKILDENDDAARYLRVQVAPSEAKALVISRQKPKYPPIALAARVSGAVMMQTLVGKAGEVEKIVVQAGPPMVQQAALDAAQKWKFKPVTVGARAVPYAIQLVFTFRTTGPQFDEVVVAP